MSRRRFLLAGAGVVAAGAAAVGGEVASSARGQRALHAAGVIGGPDHEPRRSTREVATGTLDSAAMRGPVRWVLSRPVGVGGPVPLVVCLHGRGEGEGFAMDEVRVPDMVAEVGASLAVASVAGGTGSYWHRRASGIDPEAMVVDELVPMLRQRLGDVPVGLLGWSMGGYGALLLAGRHPDVFSACVAASPAVWDRYGQAAPGAFDSAADFAANDVRSVLPALRAMGPAVRIDCGAQDPFAGMARRLRAALPAAGGSMGRGFHDAGYWRSVAPAEVRLLSTVLTRRVG